MLLGGSWNSAVTLVTGGSFSISSILSRIAKSLCDPQKNDPEEFHPGALEVMSYVLFWLLQVLS